MRRILIAIAPFLLLCVQVAFAGTKKKAHSHTGILSPYDGKHIPYSITKEQNEKLENGQPVIINERKGSSGRGILIQDVNAPPNVVMSKIVDLVNYPRMVPAVKKVDIYDRHVYENGTIQEGAEFSVKVSLLTFGYYLVLTQEPQYNTFTWTLDYRYNSDFDDNTGHWQVVPHPKKAGWSRVLYSTEVKLFSWIPEFVITFLTKQALLDANTWVKRESEKQTIEDAAAGFTHPPLRLADVSACFIEDDSGARYETHCSLKSKQSEPSEVDASSTPSEEKVKEEL